MSRPRVTCPSLTRATETHTPALMRLVRRLRRGQRASRSPLPSSAAGRAVVALGSRTSAEATSDPPARGAQDASPRILLNHTRGRLNRWKLKPHKVQSKIMAAVHPQRAQQRAREGAALADNFWIGGGVGRPAAPRHLSPAPAPPRPGQAPGPLPLPLRATSQGPPGAPGSAGGENGAGPTPPAGAQLPPKLAGAGRGLLLFRPLEGLGRPEMCVPRSRDPRAKLAAAGGRRPGHGLPTPA